MTTPADVLRIASGELGYVEERRNGSGNFSKFGAWYGIDPAPWCAMFVSWCFFSAGLPQPASSPKGFASCQLGLEWFRAQGSLQHGAAPGDIVFYQFDSDAPVDHVGIVETVNPDGSLVALEGNTSTSNNANGGQVMRRRRSRGLIAGIARPQYADGPGGSQTPAPPWPGRNLALTSPYLCGADVRTWQARMAQRGWRIGVDGVYGRQSDDTCRSFQQEKALTVDGVVGPRTWEATWTMDIT